MTAAGRPNETGGPPAKVAATVVGHVPTRGGEQPEPVYRQAYELRKKLLAHDHSDLVESRTKLIELLRQQGRATEAEALAREAGEAGAKKEATSSKTNLLATPPLNSVTVAPPVNAGSCFYRLQLEP